MQEVDARDGRDGPQTRQTRRRMLNGCNAPAPFLQLPKYPLSAWPDVRRYRRLLLLLLLPTF